MSVSSNARLEQALNRWKIHEDISELKLIGSRGLYLSSFPPCVAEAISFFLLVFDEKLCNNLWKSPLLMLFIAAKNSWQFKHDLKYAFHSTDKLYFSALRDFYGLVSWVCLIINLHLFCTRFDWPPSFFSSFLTIWYTLYASCPRAIPLFGNSRISGSAFRAHRKFAFHLRGSVLSMPGLYRPLWRAQPSKTQASLPQLQPCLDACFHETLNIPFSRSSHSKPGSRRLSHWCSIQARRRIRSAGILFFVPPLAGYI